MNVNARWSADVTVKTRFIPVVILIINICKLSSYVCFHVEFLFVFSCSQDVLLEEQSVPLMWIFTSFTPDAACSWPDGFSCFSFFSYVHFIIIHQLSDGVPSFRTDRSFRSSSEFWVEFSWWDLNPQACPQQPPTWSSVPGFTVLSTCNLLLELWNRGR